MDAFSMSISVGLQYGIPLEFYVSKFSNLRFEPAGMTDDPDVRIATSVLDYLFRRLALDHLPYEKRAQLGIFSAEERTRAGRRALTTGRASGRSTSRACGPRSIAPATEKTRARRRAQRRRTRARRGGQLHRAAGAAPGQGRRRAAVHDLRHQDASGRVLLPLRGLRLHQRLQLRGHIARTPWCCPAATAPWRCSATRGQPLTERRIRGSDRSDHHRCGRVLGAAQRSGSGTGRRRAAGSDCAGAWMDIGQSQYRRRRVDRRSPVQPLQPGGRVAGPCSSSPPWPLVCELGQYLAVHDAVGAGVVARRWTATPSGESSGQARSDIETIGSGSAAASSSSAAEAARSADARSRATSATVAARSRRQPSIGAAGIPGSINAIRLRSTTWWSDVAVTATAQPRWSAMPRRTPPSMRWSTRGNALRRGRSRSWPRSCLAPRVGAPFPTRAGRRSSTNPASRAARRLASTSRVGRWPGWVHRRIPWLRGQPSPTGGHACSRRDRHCRAGTDYPAVPFLPRSATTG